MNYILRKAVREGIWFGGVAAFTIALIVSATMLIDWYVS